MVNLNVIDFLHTLSPYWHSGKVILPEIRNDVGCHGHWHWIRLTCYSHHFTHIITGGFIISYDPLALLWKEERITKPCLTQQRVSNLYFRIACPRRYLQANVTSYERSQLPRKRA